MSAVEPWARPSRSPSSQSYSRVRSHRCEVSEVKRPSRKVMTISECMRELAVGSALKPRLSVEKQSLNHPSGPGSMV